MYINDINFIKKVIEKWNVDDEYLPTSLEINLNNNEKKIIDFVYGLAFVSSKGEASEIEISLIKKSINFIKNEKNIVDSKGTLIVHDDEIKSINLYVCTRNEYFSRKRVSAFGEYKWPLKIEGKTNN